MPTAFKLFARAGVVVGIALSLVVILVCSSFVTRVDVSGAEDAHLRMQILSLLESNGVKPWGNALKIDENALSKSLLSIEGVAFASVRRSGGRVYVFVKQELEGEEFFEVDGFPLTAKKRAVVTRVIVTGGTAVVKYGDVVEGGDLLIDGYAEYGEERLPVRASGEVFGKVYYQKKLFFADTTYVKTYGREKTLTKLAFFGRTPKTPKCDFEEYELETTKGQSGFLLPCDIYRYVFKEIISVERTEPLTDEQMKSRAFSSLVQEIESAVKLLDVYFEIETTSGGKYVTVTIEAEERIS